MLALSRSENEGVSLAGLYMIWPVAYARSNPAAEASGMTECAIPSSSGGTPSRLNSDRIPYALEPHAVLTLNGRSMPAAWSASCVTSRDVRAAWMLGDDAGSIRVADASVKCRPAAATSRPPSSLAATTPLTASRGHAGDRTQRVRLEIGYVLRVCRDAFSQCSQDGCNLRITLWISY